MLLRASRTRAGTVLLERIRNNSHRQKPHIVAWRPCGSPDRLGTMGPNRRAQERERAAARAAEEAKRAEAERKAAAEAQNIVEIWNARQAGGRALWFYPTIGAAIAAGLPWLAFYCPACRVVGSVDLRTIDRHPNVAISSLIPSLSCRRCSPHPPFANSKC
jgi:hypothetical protein